MAWVLGGLVAEAAHGRLSGEVSTLVGGMVGGAALGTLQLPILRLRFWTGLWWVATTTAVLGLLSCGAAYVWLPGGLVVTYMPMWGHMGLSPANAYVTWGVASAIVGGLFGSAIGGLLGVSQWLVIRQAMPGSGRWVVMNVVGLGLGLAVGATALSWLMLALSPGRMTTMLAILLGGGLRGVVSGAVTARTLLRLLEI